MPTLFDLTTDVLQLEELLDSIGGDITDAEVEAQIDQWLAEVSENLNDKLDGYVMLVAEYDARSEARKKEAERLLHRSKVDANNRDRLKDRLKYFFERTGKRKVETPRFRISLANNGGKIPLIVIPDLDPTEAPKEFQKIVTTLDNDAVRAALEGGQQLEFASLGERGRHIRIS